MFHTRLLMRRPRKSRSISCSAARSPATQPACSSQALLVSVSGAADAVAKFGGSWTFVALFVGAMVGWVVLNVVLLAHQGRTFDPYPYILLNLFLSMLAAIQAPVILMSQNRQAAKDRVTAEHDYEVNLDRRCRCAAWQRQLGISFARYRFLWDSSHALPSSLLLPLPKASATSSAMALANSAPMGFNAPCVRSLSTFNISRPVMSGKCTPSRRTSGRA